MAKRNVRRSRRPRRAPRRVTKKAVTRAVRSVRNRVFNRRVRDVISREVETKNLTIRNTKLPACLQNASPFINNNMWILNPVSAADAATYGVPAGPDRGTGDGQRIGNTVRPVKVWLNIVMFPEGYDAIYNPNPRPLTIRFWFFRTKRNQNTIPTPAQLCGAGNFFTDGTGQTGFVGNLSDCMQRLNPDLYTYVGHKDVKLGFSSYNGTGSNTQPLDHYYQNNDYKLNHIMKLDVTKYVAKRWQWDDSNNTVHPNTYCIMQLNAADGTTLGLNDVTMRAVYTLGFRYKDA